MKGKDLLLLGAAGVGVYLLTRNKGGGAAPGGAAVATGDQYVSWRLARPCPAGYGQIGDPFSGAQCIPTIPASLAQGAAIGTVTVVGGTQRLVVAG